MAPDEFAAFLADVDAQGQLEPAVTWVAKDGEKYLLDGRHRAQAATELGRDLVAREFVGGEDEARAFVLSVNVHRRHLSASQRSLIAGALAVRGPGRTKAATLPGSTTAAAAASVGVSERSARDGKLVVTFAPEEIVEAVASGELSVSDAAGLVRGAHRDRREAARLYLQHRRSSASDIWLTPSWLVERIIAALGGIDLDPTAEDERGIPAQRHCTEVDNCLERGWSNPDGSPARVFMNPPYNQGGRGPGPFTRKLVAEFDAGRVSKGLLLLPARVGASWLSELSRFPRLELTGRLTFEPGVGNPARESPRQPAQFSSVIIGVGVTAKELHTHFGDAGVVMVRYEDAAAESFPGLAWH